MPPDAFSAIYHDFYVENYLDPRSTRFLFFFFFLIYILFSFLFFSGGKRRRESPQNCSLLNLRGSCCNLIILGINARYGWTERLFDGRRQNSETKPSRRRYTNQLVHDSLAIHALSLDNAYCRSAIRRYLAPKFARLDYRFGILAVGRDGGRRESRCVVQGARSSLRRRFADSVGVGSEIARDWRPSWSNEGLASSGSHIGTHAITSLPLDSPSLPLLGYLNGLHDKFQLL
ncbi:hypothetical protein PUN28_012620 [Cardiocondyla obscurior]|uniref:Maturase K n=1 Tax=Cardiocondyla obscurior TaxID=286306 RepID=A0AAW2FDM2_9HYME